MNFLENRALVKLVGAGVFLLLVAFSWIGYLGSDDATYIRGAYGWLEAFPYVGGHGTIRYTLTLPIAVAFFLFGENEFSAALPSLLYSLAVVYLVVRICQLYLGNIAALFAGLFVISNPLVVASASYASIDIVEAFFVIASMTMFLAASVQPGEPYQQPRIARLIAAGGLAGLAFLTRETAAFLIIFYGGLFLVSFGLQRRHYWWMAVGFLAVWGAEILYLWAMTGDPLYRVTIALNHDSTIDRLLPWAGNLTAHPIVDPVLVLFFNQEFALIFWLALPVIIYQMRRHPHKGDNRNVARIALCGAALWFALSAAAVTLLPLNPRYFLVVFLFISIATAAAAERLWFAGPGPRRLILSATTLIVVSNFAALYLENKELRFGEKQLVALAAENAETIYTDPMTIYRAEHLLRWADESGGVKGTPPPAGSLYLYNPANANNSNRFVRADEVAHYRPRPEWQLVAEIHPSRRWAASLLKWLGIADLLPGRVHKLLFQPHSGVALFRIPPILEG